MPQRLQRKRTKGWRKPDGAIVVSRPSKYGNPFHTHVDGFRVHPAFCATIHYLWIEARLLPELAAIFVGCNPMPVPPTKDEIRRDLAGHDLLCWCGEGSACHADMLLHIANEVQHG
jgi:hypothetical protein